MGQLLDQLNERKVLVSDGAWGTMLQARGMTPEDCPEQWNITHADDVRAVAAAYAQAGSDLVLTNTFGGSRPKLDKAGLGEHVAEFNAAGANLSLEGAGEKALVAASIGPTGEFLQPLGELSESQMEDVYREQIEPIFSAGVNIVCIETQSAIEEVACAVRAARSLNDAAEVITTFAFDLTPKGPRTMMGADPQKIVEQLTPLGVDVFGSNCGNGIEGMIEVAGVFASLIDKPILIHANAGLPELINGQTVFRQSPEDFSARTAELVAAGAKIIGGCCGTTPEHIVAMRQVVDGLQ
jgi:5-methyltetrahydrofolate--homocysteine methyltransferase